MEMRTSNPALKTFEELGEATAFDQAVDAYGQPSYTGPRPNDDRMTVSGVAWATGALLVLLLGAAVFGWNSVEASPTGGVDLPGWTYLVAIAGFAVAIGTMFKPPVARFTAPVYALLEGAFLGSISKAFNEAYDGIVVNAVGLTLGVFAIMLFLYATRAIRVTNRLRTGIMAATGAVALVYLASFVVHLFGGEFPFIHDSSALGIGISLFVVGLAAFNLLLDFDLVERGVEAGAPRHYEWFAAFGLLVTLVWLYLELLRLLAKLQGRD
ncbi:MAG: Bax inhibitor-1/YccA family protein [Actinomycetota bacterium]|nr:Bax inhibitor-1/YccA family protein [Actinomycetota bacterium]